MFAIVFAAACGGADETLDRTDADAVQADAVESSDPSSTTLASAASTELGPESTPASSTASTTTALSVPAASSSVAEPTTSSSATTAAPETTTTEQTTTAATGTVPQGTPETVRIRFESQVADVGVDELASTALTILNDPRGWVQAGFTFVADDAGPYRVVLAEGPEVDALCLPLRTYGTVSCQNGPVVALNADRWRSAVDHWVLGVDVYRGYLVNHEVGHLIGQRHPKPRCPVPGRPAGVMEQQTAGLEGCVGNPWPRDWEISYAASRPVVYAPLPDWGPDPVPVNSES